MTRRTDIKQITVDITTDKHVDTQEQIDMLCGFVLLKVNGQFVGRAMVEKAVRQSYVLKTVRLTVGIEPRVARVGIPEVFTTEAAFHWNGDKVAIDYIDLQEVR
jgi:hypothetical protein